MGYYFKNNFGNNGVAFVVWANKWGSLYAEKYDTVEDLLNDCARDYIPSMQPDYREEVKLLLAEYIREIYKEEDQISHASNGDGRKFVREHCKNRGRLFAIEDIAKALGMGDVIKIGSSAYHYYDNPRTSGLPHYYSEDVEELMWVKNRVGDDLYNYGFEETE